MFFHKQTLDSGEGSQDSNKHSHIIYTYYKKYKITQHNICWTAPYDTTKH